MNARTFLAAASTALFLNAAGASAKDGQLQTITPPADAKIDFAVRFPQGTIMKFAYSPNDGDHPLNRNDLFFCPQGTGAALPALCFQQLEEGSSSTSSLKEGYSNFSAHLGQFGNPNFGSGEGGNLNLDFAQNKLALSCPAQGNGTDTDGDSTKEAKPAEGKLYTDAEKAQLEQSVRDGRTKLLSLPDYDQVRGVFQTSGGDTIIVTWPRYNFSVDGIGYFRGVGDMTKYKVTGYSESNGYSFEVQGQGTLHVPFNLFGGKEPSTLTSENGIVTQLRRIDPEAPPAWVRDQFGTPKQPKDGRRFDTPCASGSQLNF